MSRGREISFRKRKLSKNFNRRVKLYALLMLLQGVVLETGKNASLTNDVFSSLIAR
jgi:hypothetical protein